MAVAGCQIDSQWFSSDQSWWMLQHDSTDYFTRGRIRISCGKVEEHPRDKDQQIWSAQSWHQYHRDSVVSSNLQAWCSFENGNDVQILEKIEQASWSMLENHKRCSCKIWNNIANIRLFESLSNIETRGWKIMLHQLWHQKLLLPWLEKMFLGAGWGPLALLQASLIFELCQSPCRLADIRGYSRLSIICFMDLLYSTFGWTWLFHVPKICRRLFSGLSCCQPYRPHRTPPTSPVGFRRVHSWGLGAATVQWLEQFCYVSARAAHCDVWVPGGNR